MDRIDESLNDEKCLWSNILNYEVQIENRRIIICMPKLSPIMYDTFILIHYLYFPPVPYTEITCRPWIYVVRSEFVIQIDPSATGSQLSREIFKSSVLTAQTSSGTCRFAWRAALIRLLTGIYRGTRGMKCAWPGYPQTDRLRSFLLNTNNPMFAAEGWISLRNSSNAVNYERWSLLYFRTCNKLWLCRRI